MYCVGVLKQYMIQIWGQMQAKGQQGIKRGFCWHVRLNWRTAKHVLFVHIVLSLHLIRCCEEKTPSRNVMFQTHSSRENFFWLRFHPPTLPTDSYIIQSPFFLNLPFLVSSGALHWQNEWNECEIRLFGFNKCKQCIPESWFIHESRKYLKRENNSV